MTPLDARRAHGGAGREVLRSQRGGGTSATLGRCATAPAEAPQPRRRVRAPLRTWAQDLVGVVERGGELLDDEPMRSCSAVYAGTWPRCWPRSGDLAAVLAEERRDADAALADEGAGVVGCHVEVSCMWKASTGLWGLGEGRVRGRADRRSRGL